MSRGKKNFRNNPALAFMNAQEAAQEVEPQEEQERAHDVAQYATPEDAQEEERDQAHEVTYEDAYVTTQEVAYEHTSVLRESYVRTQGRKGQKKPRISLAFDSAAYLDVIRTHADREGKSITQFVNDAVRYYLEHENRGRQ